MTSSLTKQPASSEATSHVTHLPAAETTTKLDSSAADHTLHLSRGKHATLALRTVPVTLSNGKRKIKINALLDDGSTVSYINSSVAKELQLEGETQQISVSVLNGTIETFNTMPVTFDILTSDESSQFELTALTTENATSTLKATDWAMQAQEWDHLQDITFPPLHSRHIDLLIGVDHAHLHAALQEVAGKPGDPIARRTPLGWTCIGTTNQQSARPMSFFTHNGGFERLDKTLQQFWEIDSCGSHPPSHHPIPEPEQIAIDTVAKSLTLGDNGHYRVSLPWNTRRAELKNNYDMAVQRLTSTEKRLAREDVVASAYSTTIQQYLDKDYIREVPEAEVSESKWFLPHFPVTRFDKSTTKVRIVFDASAKFKGISLNDTILPGPTLQRDVFDVLLRFRHHPVAVVCDVKEMYMQIEMSSEDRKYLRFLWHDKESGEIKIYEFNRLVFGLNVSPFIAHYVIQEHARRAAGSHPLGAEAILKSTYMDDSLDSAANQDTAVKLCKELSTVWSGAGMKARKWLSNSKAVLENVPQDDRQASLDLASGELPATKTLGVQWIASDDNFGFMFATQEEGTITKRLMARRLATVFDPLGFLAPVVILGKILVQDMWAAGVEWDDPVPENIATAARKWFDELPALASMRIPRCIYPDGKSKAKRYMASCMRFSTFG